MEFRGTIVLSAVAHATIFMMALTIAGSDTAFRPPEKYVAVTLLEEAVGRNPATGTDRKKELPRRTVTTAAKLLEVVPPEVPLPAAEPEKAPAVAPPEKNRPLQEAAGPAGPGPVEKGKTASSEQSGGVATPGTSPTAVQLAIPGEAATQGGVEGGKNETTKGDTGEVNAIRAAIERAKSYPPLARIRGIEGTVTAEFTISAKGYPENIRIVRSSGHEILDSAAKKTILRASPFPPMRETLQVPITFKIDR